MRNLDKFLLILTFLVAGGTGLGMWFESHMWPFFQIGFGLIGIIILFGIWNSEYKLVYLVSGSLGVSIILTHAVYIPASLPGRDPNFFFIAAQKIVTTGSIESIGLTFYGAAPGFIIYLATIMHIFGGPLIAFVIFVVMSSLAFPVSVSYATNSLTKNRFSIFLSAFIALFSQTLLKLAIDPIAQSIHIITICMMGALIVKFISTTDHRYLLPMFLIGSIWMFSHKLPLIMLLGACIGIITIYSLRTLIFRTPLRNKAVQFSSSLVVLTGLLAAIQQTIMTPYIPNVILLLFTPYRETTNTTSLIGTAPPLGILHVFDFLSNERIVVAGALVAFAILFIYFSSDESWTSLGYIGGSSVIGVIAVFTFVPYVRVLISLFPLFMGAMGAASTKLYESFWNGASYLLIGFLVVLVVSQAFAAGPMPDDPRSAQRYLDAEDATSKEWVISYVPGPAYGDSQYAFSTLPSRLETVAKTVNPAIQVFDQGEVRELKQHSHFEEPVVTREVDYYFSSYIYNYYLENPNYIQRRNLIYSSGEVNVTV